MKRSLSNENDDQLASTSQQQQPQHYMIDSNTIALPHESRTNTAMTSTLNNLSPTPKTILRSQQSQSTSVPKNVTIHSQPEIIQLQSNRSSLNALSNPCYFDSVDRYDIEQHVDNRVVISIRGGQNSANNNNNNNNTGNTDREITQF